MVLGEKICFESQVYKNKVIYVASCLDAVFLASIVHLSNKMKKIVLILFAIFRMPLHPSEAVHRIINMLPITLNLKAVLQNANKPLPVPSVPPRETKEQRNQLRPIPQLYKNGQNQD